MGAAVPLIEGQKRSDLKKQLSEDCVLTKPVEKFKKDCRSFCFALTFSGPSSKRGKLEMGCSYNPVSAVVGCSLPPEHSRGPSARHRTPPVLLSTRKGSDRGVDVPGGPKPGNWPRHCHWRPLMRMKYRCCSTRGVKQSAAVMDWLLLQSACTGASPALLSVALEAHFLAFALLQRQWISACFC